MTAKILAVGFGRLIETLIYALVVQFCFNVIASHLSASPVYYFKYIDICCFLFALSIISGVIGSGFRIGFAERRKGKE